MKTYDIVIIGGGTAGIFAAYELNKLRPEAKIAIVEQGNPIRRRVCPIVEGKVKTCINCKNCSIMNGFGGAGAFSDGKFNFTTEFGGWLNDYLPDDKVMDLIEYVDSVNVAFGATTQRFSTYSDAARALEKKALEHDLHLLQASVKHLGTERNLDILSNIYDYLQTKVDILCNTADEHIIKTPAGEYELVVAGAADIKCKYLVAAPGRSGADWFSAECKKLGIELVNNQCYVDPASEGLVCYWRLDGLVDGVFQDLTGNGNHGIPSTENLTWYEGLKCPVVD